MCTLHIRALLKSKVKTFQNLEFLVALRCPFNMYVRHTYVHIVCKYKFVLKRFNSWYCYIIFVKLNNIHTSKVYT